MTVKLLKSVTLLSTTLLLTFVVNGVHCNDSERIKDLGGHDVSLKERVADATSRKSWNQLITTNLNGYFDTLIYFFDPSDLDILPGFNTTKSTTVALLGHFALILSGIYFLSLLPNGSLNGLIPRNPFSRRRNVFGDRRRKYRNREQQPYYNDYDYNEYVDDYEFDFQNGPPRDHNRRALQHGPPAFNRRMSEAKFQRDEKDHRHKTVSSSKSVKSDNSHANSYGGFMHSAKLVKRQADADVPWFVSLMNFATGPFSRFQRSYSQLQDHYGGFWRDQFSTNEPAAQKNVETAPRIPPPTNLATGIRNMNRGLGSFLTRLTKGVERVAGVEAQRRSSSSNYPPQRRRNQGGHKRRKFRQGKSQQDESRSFKTVELEEEYGPPPSAPAESVVQALHEE